VGHHAHGVQKFATQKFHPHDAPRCIHWKILLQQQEIVWQPQRRLIAQQPSQFIRRLQQVHTRPAAALLGLEQRGPSTRPSFEHRLGFIERQ
jgi:hypothetical protein